MNKNELPDQLYTAGQCREIDRFVISTGSVTGYALMSQAGQFAFDCLVKHFPHAKRLVIVCGSGNNGGDGYVIASLAKDAGYQVDVFALSLPATQDAKQAYEHAVEHKCEIVDCSDSPVFSEQLNCADVIVDAILGTGVDRNVTGYLAQIISWINASPANVLACDVPTGLNSDTGQIMGCCIRASLTVTFIALKAGMFTGQGKAHCGVLRFTDLQLAESDYINQKPCAVLIGKSQLYKRLIRRAESAHKGTTGYAAIIGGAPGMMGAVLMAGKAAYRVGCGRVKVLTHDTHAPLLGLHCPELLTVSVNHHAPIQADLKEFNAIAIGPGLGKDKWGKSLFEQALQMQTPMVVDADGLNLLAKNRQKRDNWILTPHPGEAARLLDTTTNEIEANRFEAVSQISRKYGGVCVLKGSGTLIAGPDKPIYVCRNGNAGQATAGMGDVLTGCITGLLAQGYPLIDAAILGTWLHANGADILMQQNQKIGMMATDLLEPIQKLHNELINESG